MARVKQPPDAQDQEPEYPPPFYEATEDLYLYNPESGAMPVAVFRTGDRVLPDDVRPEWGGKLKVPDMYAEQLQPPATDPPPASEPQADPPAPNADDSAGKE